MTNPPLVVSSFCQGVKAVSRILESAEYNVWCCSPIYDDDGKVHVFYSRWPNAAGHQGWLSCCEIAHAVADSPEGPYETVDVALQGRGGQWWDAMTCHNPTIHKVGEQYVLFYMGTADGTEYTKRVGLATSDSLYGPWERSGSPIIEPDPNPDAWNSLCTTNPAFLAQPNGELWLYYKSWSKSDWEQDIANNDWRNSNRQYGLAIAQSLAGPWIKQGDTPMIDLRHVVSDAQSEDAYIWREGSQLKMIMRDMGYWNHEYGLYFESSDGLTWSSPQVAFWDSQQYFPEPKNGLDREGRFERPQLLLKDGKPDYLFVAFRGGMFNTSSAAVLNLA